MTEKVVRVALQPTRNELFIYAAVVALVVVCATVLAASKDLASGDVLAIYTAAISGTTAVAGARAGNRSQRVTDTRQEAQ